MKLPPSATNIDDKYLEFTRNQDEIERRYSFYFDLPYSIAWFLIERTIQEELFLCAKKLKLGSPFIEKIKIDMDMADKAYYFEKHEDSKHRFRIECLKSEVRARVEQLSKQGVAGTAVWYIIPSIIFCVIFSLIMTFTK